MDFTSIIDEYAQGVKSGRIASCVWTRKAAMRYLQDLARSKSDAFPFFFSSKAANTLLSFAQELRPGDLNGDTLRLLPWQVFVLSQLEGWRHKADEGRKRFRTAYIEVNRKNGKTTGILLPLVLFNFLKYRSSESYLISSRDDLAEKTFKEVSYIIHSDKALDSVLKCQSLAITFKDTREQSRLGFFCDGGKSVDGFRPRFFCLDEYHEYATDKMLASMLMGMRSKADAQGVMITTADTDVSRPCYEQNTKAKRVLTGTQTQEDFFAIIYAIDETDDYHDKSVWIKANPSLGAFISEDVIASDVQDAELTPHKLPELKAKTFGIWGGGGEHSWIATEVWQKNAEEVIDWESFAGEECFGGLDLAQVDDMCAFTLMFEREGKRYFKHRFYIPQETVFARYQKENVNFLAWVDSGVVTAIPGATVDYNFILSDILQDATKYNIQAIGYDKWKARELIDAIDGARPDIALVEVDQRLQKLSSLTQNYEKLIRDGKLVDNSPVMIWMINNVVIKPDTNGNYKPLKNSRGSTQRIDGVISSIMALGVAESENFKKAPRQLDWETIRAMMV